VIRSPDIDRAVAFYECIGLRFQKHSHGNGPLHYASDINHFVFEIYPSRNQDDVTHKTRFGFRVNDVDSIVDNLAQLGATIRTPPNDTEWGRRAVVNDLDGHTVELVGSTRHVQTGG
jgi:catechol 2,3-dioxygenase-like lactoylglutathione lyase family enzyme